MKTPLLSLTLLAALAGTPALAQQADDAAPAAETPQEQPTPAIGGDLDLGEAETSGPATYIREAFADWQLQCIEVPEGEDVCQMYQLLQDPNGANVAEVSIYRLGGGGQAVAGGTFVVPLETLLTQKLSIAVDGGSPKRYDFSFCAQIGCYARVGFTAEDVNRFKAGAMARVSIVPALAPDQRVTVEMSLSGFTAAFEASSEVSQ